MNVYSEVLTWILCSCKENFAMLNRKDDNSAVIIGNPRSADFEVPPRSFAHLFVHFSSGNILLNAERFSLYVVIGHEEDSHARNIEDSWFKQRPS